MSLKEKLGLLSASMLVGLGAAATPALAQNNTQQQQAQNQTADQPEEQIVVTGSRIRHDNFNSASPIQVITRDESVRAGLSSTTEILQSSAVTGGGGQLNNLFGGFVVNGGAGVNTLGLRGFGPTDTLILLNGRRLTPAGTTGSVGAVDLNVIPTSLVSRIEVLKDGASSVYGSDAVAGVVNIITDQNLDRVVIEGQRNMTESGGGDQSLITIAAGHQFGPLQLTGSLEYFYRAPLTYGQRDYTSCPTDLVWNLDGSGNRTTRLDDTDPLNPSKLKCWTIEFPNSAGVTINTIGTGVAHGIGGPGAVPPFGGIGFPNYWFRWRPNSGISDGPGGNLDGFEGVNGGGLGFGARDTFDPRMLDGYLLTPTRNTNAYFQAKFDLDDHNQLYGEALYSERESKNNNFIQLSLDYPNNALLAGNPDLQNIYAFTLNSTFPNPPPTGAAGAAMPAPYATQVRAFIGIDNYTARQDVQYTRFVAGARGDFPFLHDWQYDFNVYYGNNKSENTNPNFLTDRIFNSLVVTTTIPGGTPANLIRTLPGGTQVICQITSTNPAYGCIPAPALTTQTISGHVPADWLSWVLNNQTETTKYHETAESFVINGPTFDLPGGPLQLVLGLEHRNNHIDDEPSLAARESDLYNFSQGQPTIGSDSVSEAFVESEFPLLRDAPFAHSLTINLSARYTDYHSYGSGFTHKYQASWEPVDGLMLRATSGTSYRAPALFEQFLGAVSGFRAGNQDPCDSGHVRTAVVLANCASEGLPVNFVDTNGITVFNGGGAANHLSAETSKNHTIGLTFHMLRDQDSWGDFSFAADNFAITLTNAVVQLGDINIMNQCYGSVGFSDPTCALVSRDGLNRLTVLNNYVNVSEQKAQGWDFGARYRHSLLGGTGTVIANMTEYTKQTNALFPSQPALDTNNLIGSPRLSGDVTFEYDRGPWNAHYGITWINAMSDARQTNGFLNPNADGSARGDNSVNYATSNYFLSNASLTYKTDRWSATLGVRNLFDRSPPLVTANDQNINQLGDVPFYSGLDYFGRTFFVNMSANF